MPPKHKKAVSSSHVASSAQKQSAGAGKSNSARASSTLGPGLVDILRTMHHRLQALEPEVVTKPSGGDLKDVKEAVTRAVALPLTVGRPGRFQQLGVIGKGGAIKVRFTTAITVTSAANTAYVTPTSLTPGSLCPEFAYWANLFDDWRTTHFRVQVQMTPVVQATGVISNVANLASNGGWIVSYDPVDNTALSSVSDGLDFAQHLGVRYINFYGGQPGNSLDAWKDVKIPDPVVDPGILSDLLDSNWVSTKDTAVVVGYLKPYVPPLGATLASNLYYYIQFFCEFKSRH